MKDEWYDLVKPIRASVKRFVLSVEFWKKAITTIYNFNWKAVPLTSHSKNKVPESPGLYTLLIQPGCSRTHNVLILCTLGDLVICEKDFISI